MIGAVTRETIRRACEGEPAAVDELVERPPWVSSGELLMLLEQGVRPGCLGQLAAICAAWIDVVVAREPSWEGAAALAALAEGRFPTARLRVVR